MVHKIGQARPYRSQQIGTQTGKPGATSFLTYSIESTYSQLAMDRYMRQLLGAVCAPRKVATKIPSRYRAILLCLLLALTPVGAIPQSGRPLSNQDIVKMVHAGFDDSTILKYMQASDIDFDLSVQAMVALKDAGVNQSLIQSMLSVSIAKKGAHGNALLQAIAAGNTGDPNDIGFYAMRGGKLFELDPETVKWRTSMIKSSLTSKKGSINGVVSGPHSQLAVTWPPLNMVPLDVDFYVVCPDDAAASNFQLLKLWEKGDKREFRDVLPTPTGDPQSSTVPFTMSNVAPKIYKITLPILNVGEYGFLAPVTQVNSNAPSEGKIFTFQIVER